MKKPEKVTIDRTHWGRGKLFASDTGCSCAAGFLLRTMGFEPPALDGIGNVAVLHQSTVDLIRETLGLMPYDNFFTEVYMVNDGRNFSPLESREKRLVKAFAKVGIELEFTGSYEDGVLGSFGNPKPIIPYDAPLGGY